MLIGLRSRKHISPFELVRPASLEAACRALSALGRNVAMAGGIDLIDRLKLGEAVDRVIHLSGVRELSGIRRDGDTVSIGALTTHAEVISNPLLAEVLPDLPAIWRGVANPRVRHTGTIGGNLMSAMPHYDAAPALLALGASLVKAGTLLERVRIPIAPHQRLLAERSLHPIISVYLGARLEGGKIHSARIAVGCCHAQPATADLPLAGVSVTSLGADAAAIASKAAASFAEPLSDGLASGSYRRRMIEVLTRRLLIKLGSQP
ncbi:FAD binding domain-containing protein [Rhodoplanes sp. Z2-YC6860]|uniref:FAD binding domain-containing protein n=1 Tax=Rhodoplanes sp. Z2-YC6860 TaxID=674703 RepID=UPI00082C1E07|nr:FAD binding domain-containing protein [Rhodoplanes sp. Z2-YC6860]